MHLVLSGSSSIWCWLAWQLVSSSSVAKIFPLVSRILFATVRKRSLPEMTVPHFSSYVVRNGRRVPVHTHSADSDRGLCAWPRRKLGGHVRRSRLGCSLELLQLSPFLLRYEESESRWCYAGLITFSFGCYAVALTGIVLMFIFYTTVGFSYRALGCWTYVWFSGRYLRTAEVLHIVQYDTLCWCQRLVDYAVCAGKVGVYTQAMNRGAVLESEGLHVIGSGLFTRKATHS